MTLVLLALVGCRNEYSTFNSTLELVLTVSDPSPIAGERVQYLAYMDGSADPIAVEDLALTSDLEDSMFYDSLELAATLAGEHTLVASTTYEGEIYVATAKLDVQPGPPAVVDLALADLQTDAGASVAYTVAAWDAYDNETSAASATVAASSLNMNVGSSDVSSTVPGIYEVTATAGQASDTEVLRVVAGPPADLILTLSDTELELYETTIATVSVVDAYGNYIDEETDLWVDPGTYVDIRHNALTFGDEGYFTVYAATLDGSLSDSVGPLLIDSTGPDISIINPDRGTQTTDAGTYVSGTVSDAFTGVTGVWVNGTEATVNGDGTWEAWQDFAFGVTTISTEAVDGDDNWTSDTRSVLQSDQFTAYGDGVPNGIEARINESGFDSLETVAEDFIDIDLLESAIPSPVFSSSSKSCFLGVCITWYSIDFYLTNPSISGTDLELDPTSGGYIDTLATVYDMYLAYNVSGKLVGISYSASGYVSADDITLGMELTPFVSAGVIGLTVANTSVSFTNFDFDLDGWVYDVVEFFGIDVDGIVEGILVDQLAALMEDSVPDLVEDLVQDLEIAASFPIEANTYDLDAVPYQISVDDTGMTLGLETYFTAQNYMSSFTGPGTATYPYTSPDWSTTSESMVLGLNQDFINQALYALWAGGLLEMTLTSEDLGLDVGDLETFLPMFTDLAIEVKAWLPPVAVPGTGSSLLDMQIGDLELNLYSGEILPENLWLQAYIATTVGLELGVSGDATLSAGIGDVELHFDQTYPDDTSGYAGDTEALFEALVPMILPSLTGALGEIPIPEMEGITLSGIAVDLDGPESGYVTLGGDLDLEL
jgi:hypothetical protein